MLDQVYLYANEYLIKLLEGGQELAQTALIFFVMSAAFHYGNLKGVLAWLLPKSLRVNLVTYFVDLLFVASFLSFLLAILYHTTEGGLLGGDLGELPDAVVLVATIFFGDMVGYFRHRLEHSRLLWSSHVLHHSDEDMTWMAIYRFHPINRMTTLIIDFGALLLVGFPAWAIAVNFLVRHYYGAFIHTDLPWTYGWLGKVFVSPAMHRWHHVREGRGVGSNFATVFSVFDLLFKTYYVPGPCNVPLGVNGINQQSYFSQLFLPVTDSWRAITRGFKRLTKGVEEGADKG